LFRHGSHAAVPALSFSLAFLRFFPLLIILITAVPVQAVQSSAPLPMGGYARIGRRAIRSGSESQQMPVNIRPHWRRPARHALSAGRCAGVWCLQSTVCRLKGGDQLC
jgi:hypothetical protein